MLGRVKQQGRSGRSQVRRPRLNYCYRRYRRSFAPINLNVLRAEWEWGLGSWAGNSSGDLFLAFSTANAGAAGSEGTPSLKMLPNERIDPLFVATIDATEEAVVNAMLAAKTMTGADGIRVFGLPGDRVVAALRKYNRMK